MRESGGIPETLLSVTVAYPHAGTMPQEDWSLYGDGAVGGTGYVFHLWLLANMKDIKLQVNIPMQEISSTGVSEVVGS
jgi:hypothetical protein